MNRSQPINLGCHSPGCHLAVPVVKNQGYTYAGSGEVGTVAWYDSNAGGGTKPVATKTANELGLYDMSGNVWEWCWGWYDSYLSSAASNPTGPTTGSNRVFRGGGFVINADGCRSASRYGYSPSAAGCDVGFRVARSPGL